MKRIYMIMVAATVLCSCQRDIDTIEGFTSDSKSIEASAAGGEHSITIRSDKEWTAQTEVPWIMISPANGRGEVKCRVKIDSTLINDRRETIIRFMSSGHILSEIDVTQEGFERSIKPESSSIEIEASAIRSERWIDLGVVANVEFNAECDAEWISIDDFSLTLDRGARPRSTCLHLNWKMNSEPTPREAVIRLSPKSGGEIATPAIINIKQQAGPLIEDNRQGDSLAIVTIFNKMECWAENAISTTEGMQRWDCVRLWESTDSSLPSPEAIGRVRDFELSYFSTEDDIPSEIKHLKYLETLSLYGNVNTMLKSIKLCPEVATLAFLKDLRIAAMGIVSLPDNFAELGDTLESLDLNSNNLTEIPAVINAENFPKLKSLNLSSNRRTQISNLSSLKSDGGLHIDQSKSDVIRRLFMWERLEELALSYNYIEGELPNFKAGEEGVRAYRSDDVKEYGDTLNWAVEHNLPRILPNMRSLRINLNFMTGKLPDWLLYHPRLMEWGAETLIYSQQEKGVDSHGKNAGFDNVPKSQEYYFESYPLYRSRYEFNDEIE